MRLLVILLAASGLAFASGGDGNLGALVSAVTETDAEIRTSFFPAVASLIGGIILIALAIVVGRILSRGN